MSTTAHIPVLLAEVVEALNLSHASMVVDATYGRGGHSRAILENVGSETQLIVIDRDRAAVEHAREQIGTDQRVEVVHAPFSMLHEVLQQRDLVGKVDALLFDFGVSSPQLDEYERGFSFSGDGPLDMRMDRDGGVTAAEWISETETGDLIWVLRRFGEERYARRIAGHIKEYLKEQELTTTAELARIVSEAVPTREKGKHPATRTFQAIRIAVNHELQEIESVLPQAIDALAPGGRLVVISFHSLEDRLVKRFLRDQSKGDPWPQDLPVTADMLSPRVKLVGKPVRPGAREVSRNPRARSAVMRVAQKLDTNLQGQG